MAADVRSGLTGAQLMQKYHLSTSGLRKVCQKLLQDGLLGTLEIQGLKLPLDDGASVHKERRGIPRRVPSLQITVSDRGNEGVRGTVKDITEKGLAVKGIEADIGERKTLWILGDDLALSTHSNWRRNVGGLGVKEQRSGRWQGSGSSQSLMRICKSSNNSLNSWISGLR